MKTVANASRTQDLLKKYIPLFISLGVWIFIGKKFPEVWTPMLLLHLIILGIEGAKEESAFLLILFSIALFENVLLSWVFHGADFPLFGRWFIQILFSILFALYLIYSPSKPWHNWSEIEKVKSEHSNSQNYIQKLTQFLVKISSLSATSRLGQAIDNYLEILKEEIGILQANIFLLDEGKGELYSVGNFGGKFNREGIDVKGVHFDSEGFKKAEIGIFRPGQGQGFKKTIKELCGKDLFPGIMVFPLVSGEKFFGLVNIEKIGEKEAFFAEESLLTLVTKTFSRALDSARVFETSREDMARVKALSDAYLQQKQHLTETLGKYLPKSIIDYLAENPDKLKLGGSSCEITVMFCDIRGFTQMSEILKPEQIVSLLNEWFTQATRIIEEKGGVIDKFIGDSIMVFFGAPVPHPRGADQAMQTAIELQKFFSQFQGSIHKRYQQKIGLGIGISSGPAIVGNIGSKSRQDFTVIGATVNLGARLEGKARHGEILVDEVTRSKITAKIPFDLREGMELQGIKRPLTLHSFFPVDPEG